MPPKAQHRPLTDPRQIPRQSYQAPHALRLRWRSPGVWLNACGSAPMSSTPRGLLSPPTRASLSRPLLYFPKMIVSVYSVASLGPVSCKKGQPSESGPPRALFPAGAQPGKQHTAPCGLRHKNVMSEYFTEDSGSTSSKSRGQSTRL